MTVGIYFSICSLIYTSLLVVVFFSKKRLKTYENQIYSYLIITSLFGPLVGIPTYYFMGRMDKFVIPNMIFSKLYLVYLVMWLMIFTLYIFIISVKNIDKKKTSLLFKILMFVLILIEVILPIEYYNTDGIIYSYGPACNVMYGVSTVFIIIVIICLIKNIRYITQRKFIPLVAFLTIGSIVMVIQKLNPGLLLLSFAESFITFLMYFTIENPDLQMINELYKNKILVEKSFEDKSNFLFNMTQEVRKPITNMRNILSVLKTSDDIKDIKQGIKLMDSNSKQLDFIVNDVLDVTTLDSRNIKIVNNRYNIYNLFKDIEYRMSEYKKDEVAFRFKIDESIPILYGDSIKLKQIIMSILLNSVKKTNSGFIELSVNSIIKYDVCRLIITVEDSGVGMSIDKVNDLLVTTNELSVDDIKNLEKLDLNLKACQKSIKLLGGNLMIKSEVGKGTEVIITIDQNVYENKKTEKIMDKYEHILFNLPKVLIVSESEKEIANIKDRLDKNIMVSTSLYGQDAISKIKSGKSYDLILIADDMKNMSGLATLQELEKIEGYKIPTVVLLKETKEHIKDHYKEDGFTDYILLSNLDVELKKVIDKYC